MGNNMELLLGVLNGALGNYLKRTGNGLATSMQLVRDRPRGQLAGSALEAVPASEVRRAPSPRVAVLVHGLMSIESVWRMRDGETYGSLLARDLGCTPFYVRYNSGLHVSENGDALDVLLEQLVDTHPVPIEEIILIGHSMGGLVLRSAARAASEQGRRWLPLVKRAFYIGTPQLRTPHERFGNVVTWALKAVDNPYVKLVADVASLQNQGIKDLHFGDLRREDWEGAEANALLQNRRHPVPLLPHIRHHLIATAPTNDPSVAMLFGDALAPLKGATGASEAEDKSAIFPRKRVRFMPSMDFMRLASDLGVYAQIRAWCEEDAAADVGKSREGERLDTIQS